MLESAYRDIATIVTEKTVNPASNRPYTLNMVLNGMKALHFAVNPTRSAKQQALEVIKKLKVRAGVHTSLLCGVLHGCWWCKGRRRACRGKPVPIPVLHHTPPCSHDRRSCRSSGPRCTCAPSAGPRSVVVSSVYQPLYTAVYAWTDTRLVHNPID